MRSKKRSQHVEERLIDSEENRVRLALCRHSEAGCDGDRGGGCRGSSGGHPGRADVGRRHADAAAVFYREYCPVHLHDCEEEGEESEEYINFR